jgi:uncharacterized protein (DUF302 family)
MSYYFEKDVKGNFDEVLERTTGALKAEGFGVQTEIDVRSTLKNKLDVEFRNYRILGACNPGFAHKALLAEPQLGILMPCNVVVQDGDAGNITVSVMNPLVAMAAVQNEAMAPIAQQVADKLQRVLAAI